MNDLRTQLTVPKREQLLQLAKSLNLKNKIASLPVIIRAERRDGVPLSFAQQRLWFLAQMKGGSKAYQILMGVRLRGRLDKAAMRYALERIVARHEALRTTFFMVEGAPQQRIAPAEEGCFHLLEYDLRQQEVAQVELERLLAEEAEKGFDLEAGPLIRGTLIQMAEEEHALVIAMHHIVSDEWSMGVFFNELSGMYGAFVRGEDALLPELKVQYVDYSVWQRRWMQEGVLQQQAEYWRKNLDGIPEVLELPADHARPIERDFAGAVVEFALEQKLTARLKELSARHGTTLYMTLLGAWALLLGRLSGQKDIVIGTPVANRGRAEIENLIGFFVNTLVLRMDLSGRPTVGEMLERVKKQVVAALQHQDMPFEKVVEIVEPMRSLAHSPIFQVMFAWQDAVDDSPQLHGLKVEPLPSLPHTVSKVDLTLLLQVVGERIEGGMEYATALFERETVERYIGYFVQLLEGMVADEAQVVDRLPVVPEWERKKLLYEWNETGTEFPSEKCIHQLFEEQVEKSPGAVAAVYEDQSLSYSELNRRANQLAHYLRKLGVKPDDRVAICVERGLEMVVGLLGILKAGGAYVPLDPAYPAERVRYMLDDSGPVALLMQGHLEGLFNGMSESIQVIDLESDTPLWMEYPEMNPEPSSFGLTSKHPAYIIYTSGSTGMPKGVMVEHANVARLFGAANRWFQFGTNDVWALFHSYAFDFSVWELWGALFYGGRLIVVSKSMARSPEDFYRLLCKAEVTILNQTPSAFRQLMDVQAKSEESHQLRYVIFGGEALEVLTLKPWYEQNESGRTRLVNMYGITETTVHVTCRQLERVDTEKSGGSPIGGRIPDLKVYILDSEEEPVPMGAVGELYIGGAGVARGYWNRAGQTAERFLADPYAGKAGARMYKTGDVGRWRGDGTIEFVGRNDDQIKIRGYRIELGEIEATLASHAGVGEAVVIAREEKPGEKQLVGYWTPSAQRAFPVLQLLRLRQTVAGAGANCFTLPNGLTIFHQNQSETQSVYEEIFINEVYLRHGITLQDGDCIFDVGANIGLFTLFVTQRYRNTTIYAFEPIPQVFETLQLNGELYGVRGKNYECGLAETSKPAVFTFNPQNTVISSSSIDPEEAREAQPFLVSKHELAKDKTFEDELVDELQETEERTCQMRRLSEIIRENDVERIDLLKIDVETGEQDVLKGIEERDWPKIRQLVMEVHDSVGRLDEIVGLLRAQGYEVAYEQTQNLKNTVLYHLFAIRPGQAKSRLEEGQAARSDVQENVWCNSELLLEDVRAFLAVRLPEYMLPVAHVLMPSLPLTPNGKLDRRALPVPDRDAYAIDNYEAPQGDIEKAVATIWAELLQLERVGRHDNFFDLGGHSLLAIKVISRLRQTLAIKVSVGDLLARPVLMDFSRGLAHARIPELPPVTRVERTEKLALSFSQQQMWFLAQMEGGSQAYHIWGGMRLRGGLDRAALKQALDGIVKRHETLRTTFEMVDGEPFQRIAAAAESQFHLREQDLRPARDGQSELEAVMEEEAREGFDLEAGPVIRGRLVQVGEEEHVFLITMHHIVADGWSVGVLFQELSVLYGAFVRGEEERLPELGVQYADYAVWQRKWMEGEVLRKQAEYWKGNLAGVTELLQLPADHVRPAQQNYEGAGVQVKLNERLTAGLKELSLRQGTTLYMTLLAGWAMLLGKLSGQQEVTIGTPLANRGRAETENLIGYFVNTVVVRVDLSGQPTVEEVVERVKRQMLGAQEHQDIPFEQVVEIIQPVRSLAYNPLFQVAFSWQNEPLGKLELSGLEVVPLQEARNVAAKFDLMLSLQEAGGRIVGGAEYATALYEKRTVERYLGYLVRLLEGMTKAGGRRIDDLGMLSAEERHELVYEWNRREVEYVGRKKCVQELFEEQVERRPEAVAVVCEEQSVSYSELNRRANQLAHYLRGKGVKAEERVGICVERGVEMIVGMLGIVKAGGAYVPLDAGQPEERLRYMLEDSGARVLLVQGQLQERFKQGSEGVARVDLTAQVPLWREEPASNVERAGIGLTAQHLAYVIYTSGSSGLPKGVGIEHGSLNNLIQWHIESFGLQAGGSCSSVAGFGFDAATWEIWPALCVGARLLLATSEASGNPERLLRWWSEQKLDVGFLPTPIAEYALQNRVGLGGLQTLLIGGDRLRQFPAEPLGFSVVNNYGPTETTVVATSGRLERGSKVITIGRPIANTQVYILDEGGEVVPVGVTGELHLGGRQVGRGYLKRAELTGERFIPNPFAGEGGARMYKTGDLGRWREEGMIEFVGRNDSQVKVRGLRIELGEIEARLEEHPGVREAVVEAREDETGDKQLVGYYTVGSGSGEGGGEAAAREAGEAREAREAKEVKEAKEVEEVRGEELRDYLRQSLPEYMVPGVYVRLKELPLTVNGKVDRKALPAPEGEARVRRGYEEPMGALETAVAQIWSEVLQLERVGRYDDFFELGGHSLRVVQVAARLRQRLGVEVAMSDLFARPVLSDFVRAIESALHSKLAPTTHAEGNVAADTGPAEEDVVYENQMQGNKLAATLTIPQGKGPFPAVLLITGAGPQDRDQTTILGHKPFLVLAEYLTNRGIAVLRADDRGVGRSSGEFYGATTADFATDTEAGIAYLKQRPEVDPKTIGLVGHSEGGIIAPMVAVRNSDVAFIVMLAGTAVPGDQVLQLMLENTPDKKETLKELETQRKVLDLLKENADDRLLEEQLHKEFGNEMSPAQIGTLLHQLNYRWLRFFITYNPAKALKEVTCPVLALNGGNDWRSKQNVPAIREALEAGGNENFEIEELPGLNHLFQTANTGARSEYAESEEAISPVVLQKVGDWILKICGISQNSKLVSSLGER